MANNSSFYVDGNSYSTATVTSNDHAPSSGASQAPSSFYQAGGMYATLSDTDLLAELNAAADAALAAAAGGPFAPINNPAFTGIVGVADELHASNTLWVNKDVPGVHPGYVIVGPSSTVNAVDPYYVGLATFSIQNDPSTQMPFSIVAYNNSPWGPGFAFGKTRNASPNGHTAVVNGDQLGYFASYGSDGAGFVPTGGIYFNVDGAVSPNWVPTCVEIWTGVNNYGVPKLRVNSAGDTSVLNTTASTSSTTGALTVAGGAGIAGALNVDGPVVQGGGARYLTAFEATPAVLINERTGLSGPLSVHLYSAAYGTSAWMTFATSRSDTFGAQVAVTPDDTIMYIAAAGSDGTRFSSVAAEMYVMVDGAVADYSVPGRWVFSANKPGDYSPPLGGTFQIKWDRVEVRPTTASTSSTTGALTVAGGAGIAGNVYAGGHVSAGNDVVTGGFRLNGTYFLRNDSGYRVWLDDTGMERIVTGGIGTEVIYGVGNADLGSSYSAPQYHKFFGPTYSDLWASLNSSGLGLGVTPDMAGWTTTSKVLSIKGPSTSGVVELASGEADATFVYQGFIDFIAPNNTLGSKEVVQIYGASYGSTANNRGGFFGIATKPDGGGVPIDRLLIDQNGTVALTGTTASTSPTTGALTVAGGVGVSKDLVVGGQGQFNWTGGHAVSAEFYGPIAGGNYARWHSGTATDATLEMFINDAGGYFYTRSAIPFRITANNSATGLQITPTSDVLVENSTASTSTATGALTVAGGTGIAGRLNVGGATSLGAALTYGGVTLSNSVTGTGSMVLSTSPALTGTPTAPTAAVSTNTTQIATTAFVLGQVGTATPLINGTAAVGTSLLYARQDHVHPTDTTRAALASPTFTGTPAAPTAAVDTNTTQLATTAFVLAQAASATPLIAGTAAVGTSTRFARGDHVHPSERSSTSALGYATGAGGAVTQLTSRTTGVTLSKLSGAITLFTAAPTVGTWVSFTVTNTNVAVTDTISVSVKSGTNTYIAHVTAVGSGSFQISFTSIVGTSSDSPVINFNVIKGVNA